MTTSDFRNQFDILYNNISSDQAPGLNDYEKSVFLTKAQEELVRMYFNPLTDPNNSGIDGSTLRQYDFSNLINVQELTLSTLPNGSKQKDPRSKVYIFPDEIYLVLDETLTYNGDILAVLPLSYQEYLRQMQKPYKFPPKRTVWRLLNQSGGTKYAELIGKYTDDYAYNIRYVVKPTPIILNDSDPKDNNFPAIEGSNDDSAGSLPEAAHHEILNRAVALAHAAWLSPTSQSNINKREQ